MLRKGEKYRIGDIYGYGDSVGQTEEDRVYWIDPKDDTSNVYRPISIAPKKAKGKAKKVESVKAVQMWIVVDKGNLDLRRMYPKKKGFHLWPDQKAVLCEIRPLVTRKKGK